MIFTFYTLGCKVNQYETQAMEQELIRRGHRLAAFDTVCDCYVVNSCTVTAVSDKKTRAVLRQARRRNPQAVIGVCGCYAQTQPEALRELGVDVLSGTGDRMAFLDALERAALQPGGPRIELLGQARQNHHFEQLPAGGLEGRTRAMLKVQDGCDNFCTYCIIPYARGPVRSLPAESAVAQLHRLAEAGYRECVVTGIEVASWGKDLEGRPALPALLDALCRAEPAMRIRLGSLEPRVVDEAFAALAAHPNLCPQFHLSLQSGCDATLRRMNRHYDTARYEQSVRLLRAAFPGCAITTDLITGFPGETEDEFAQTLDFMRRIRFAAMHIFPYSVRSGTRAAQMPDQVPVPEREARAARAAALAAELTAAYRGAMVGQTAPVLFEQPGAGGLFWGHAPNYVPVGVAGQDLHGRLRQVEITAVTEGGVTGRLLPDKP